MYGNYNLPTKYALMLYKQSVFIVGDWKKKVPFEKQFIYGWTSGLPTVDLTQHEFSRLKSIHIDSYCRIIRIPYLCSK